MALFLAIILTRFWYKAYCNTMRSGMNVGIKILPQGQRITKANSCLMSCRILINLPYLGSA